MQKLDFGCGQKKQAGYIGLDIFEGEDIDVVHDFNCFPYPFQDNVFDEIVCNSSLEHVDDFFKTVTELHRIAKPDAMIKIFCPHYSSADAYRDPTHKTFFAHTTFDTFAGGGSYISPYNGMLKIERRSFGLPANTGYIKTLFKKIFNSIPDLYEHRLCWIFPAQTIYYELRVMKSGD